MKKITVFIVLCAICLSAFCACSEKKPEGKEAFSSPTVVAELFEAYEKSVSNHIMKPSSSAYAEDDVEYTYMTDDGSQTAHTKLKSYFIMPDGKWGASVKGHDFTILSGLSADGCSVRSITDKKAMQNAISVFINAFVQSTEESDYETAPDSIRAAEDDVEVQRITLKLDPDKYEKAFEKALSAVGNDIAAKEYITDVLGFYGLLHNREESAGQMFENCLNGLSDAVKNSGGQLVWQRYLYNGKVVAARLKFGDNVIRYICAEASSYTELDFSAKIGGKDISLAYEARRTGMSDTYNIRLSSGGEITYFDGTAESAYKSGNIGFELRATQNSSVVNGADLQISYNGEKQLTYKGSGNYTVKGDKKTFSFELVYYDAENVSTAPLQNDDVSLYEALKKVFD